MKQSKSALRFIVLLVLLAGLQSAWGDRLERLFRMPFSPQNIQRLWYYSRPTLIMAAVLLVLAFLTLVAFFRMIRDLSQTAPRTRKSGIKAPEVQPRAAVRRREAEAEEAIHCDHLTGRQKYLEQIDGYLRTGLIDRAEYRVLKERYNSLDIPDDYH